MTVVRVELLPETLRIVSGLEPREVEFSLAMARAWGRRYATFVRTGGTRTAEDEAILAELGAELSKLLSGEDAELERALGTAKVIEFVIDTELELAADRRQAFFALPWELLQGPMGSLLQSGHKAIVRRLEWAHQPPPRSPSRHRLLVLYMAGAPADVAEVLDYEREEARILAATEQGRLGQTLDLIVEESGVLAELRRRLQTEDSALGSVTPEVLHLSCHGDQHEGRPVLWLERPTGESDPVGADALVEALGERTPQLVFVSASTTGSWLEGPAFAESLVRAGVPATLGWAGNVTDRGATQAAETLYASLAKGAPLERALANAYAEVARHPSHDWHQLRLVLGPGAGGPLTRGPDLPSRLRPRARALTFAELPLDGRLGPAANPFVGRRRSLQRVLRLLQHGPVLLHGPTGIGKSSFAARIVQRLHGHEPVVIPCARVGSSAAELLAAFEAVPDEQREGVLAGELSLREALEPLGPLVLVLDDLDVLLDIDGQPREALEPGGLDTLRTLIELGRGGRHHVLVTGRYVPALELGLAHVPLGVLSAAEAHKLANRLSLGSTGGVLAPALVERSLAAARGMPPLVVGLIEAAIHDPAQWQRQVVELEVLARGHEAVADTGLEALVARLEPAERALLDRVAVFGVALRPPGASSDGLARLLGLGLVEPGPDRLTGAPDGGVVLAPLVRPLVPPLPVTRQAEVVRETLAQVRHVDRRERPLALDEDLLRLARIIDDPALAATCGPPVLAALSRRGAFRQGRALADELLERVRAAGLDVPPSLAWQAGEHLWRAGEVAAVEALVDRGLCESPDAGRARIGLLWLAGRVALAEGDHERARGYLSEAWETSDHRPELGLDLAELVGPRLLEAVAGLFGTAGDERGRALATEALAEHGLRRDGEPLELLADILRFHTQSGDRVARAQTSCRLARAELEASGRAGAVSIARYHEAIETLERHGDPRAMWIARLELARAMAARGELDGLEQALEACVDALGRLREARARIVALVELGRLRLTTGALDQAQATFEHAVRESEAMADPDALASVLGHLVHVASLRGELARAVELSDERIALLAGGEDRRGWAMALAEGARARVGQGQAREARVELERALEMFSELDQPRSLALGQVDLARVLVRLDELDEARRHYLAARAELEQVGDSRSCALVDGDLAELSLRAGAPEEARELHRRSLRVYEALGEEHALAVARANLAEAHAACGELDAARAHYRASLAGFEAMKLEGPGARVRLALEGLGPG